MNHSAVGNKLSPQETVKLLLTQNTEFAELLKELEGKQTTVSREDLIVLLERLSKNGYMSLYKLVESLGFTPTLFKEEDKSPKEKGRVSTFLMRYFQSFNGNLKDILS
ncbi:MAG: hypothetical protein K2X66_03875 [Cyanobacteria bacterium]|nr:hypothetical protein [Cyanobacteriota bacterium]